MCLLDSKQIRWSSDQDLFANQVDQLATLSGSGPGYPVGSRVFLPNQTNPVQNGIWIIQTGAWTRAPEMPAGMYLTPGRRVRLGLGANEYYHYAGSAKLVGTDALTFEQAPVASTTSDGLMPAALYTRVDASAKIVPPQRSWGSVLPVNPAGMQLASNAAYWVYIGRCVSTVSIARFGANVVAVGSGTQTAEWAIATSPDEPARDGKTLTVRYRHTLASGNARETLATVGAKHNQTAFAYSPPLYSYLWLGMRVVMTTTMPSFNCLYGDGTRGLALITTGAGVLTVGTDYTGASYLSTQTQQAPDLQIMLD